MLESLSFHPGQVWKITTGTPRSMWGRLGLFFPYQNAAGFIFRGGTTQRTYARVRKTKTFWTTYVIVVAFCVFPFLFLSISPPSSSFLLPPPLLMATNFFRLLLLSFPPFLCGRRGNVTVLARRKGEKNKNTLCSKTCGGNK